MPTTKEFDIKLNRLKNTEKMTRTMKLVSMSKLYRAQEAQKHAKLYAERLQDLIQRLAACVSPDSHPFLQPREKIRNVHILVFSSNKGLCGSFNNGLNKQVLAWINENKNRVEKVAMSFCGKKGHQFFRREEGIEIRKYYQDLPASPDFETASKIGDDLIGDFASGQSDEVYVAHNEYHSPLSQQAQFQKILPIECPVLPAGNKRVPPEYIFEPGRKVLFRMLMGRYIFFRIYFTFLENAAGEHGARMTAMDSASRNAAELIDRNTLLRNRARQAAITKELIEIVSGAEATEQ